MGIYIKGMEMPEGCKDVRIYADGRVISQSIRAFGEVIATAVPVPPHGNLIDRQAIFDSMENHEQKSGWINVKKIATAPTIIPAEPAKEGEA